MHSDTRQPFLCKIWPREGATKRFGEISEEKRQSFLLLRDFGMTEICAGDSLNPSTFKPEDRTRSQNEWKHRQKMMQKASDDQQRSVRLGPASTTALAPEEGPQTAFCFTDQIVLSVAKAPSQAFLMRHVIF